MKSISINLSYLNIPEDIIQRVIKTFDYINDYRKETSWSDFFNTDFINEIIESIEFYSPNKKEENSIKINYYLKSDLSKSKIKEIKEKIKILRKNDKNIDEIFENEYSSTFQNFVRYLCKIECINILQERNMDTSSVKIYANNSSLNEYVEIIIYKLIEKNFNLKLANELAKILLVVSEYIKKNFHIKKIVYIDKPDYLLFISTKDDNIILPIELTSFYPSYIFSNNENDKQRKIKLFIDLLINKWILSKSTYTIDKSKNIEKYFKDNDFIDLGDKKYISKSEEKFHLYETTICFLSTSNKFCFEELKYLIINSSILLKINKSRYIEKLNNSFHDKKEITNKLDELLKELNNFLDNCFDENLKKDITFYFFDTFCWQFIVNIIEKRFKDIEVKTGDEINIYYKNSNSKESIFIFGMDDIEIERQKRYKDMVIEILSDPNAEVVKMSNKIIFYTKIDKYKDFIIEYFSY